MFAMSQHFNIAMNMKKKVIEKRRKKAAEVLKEIGMSTYAQKRIFRLKKAEE
jgi:hypothetical protein